MKKVVGVKQKSLNAIKKVIMLPDHRDSVIVIDGVKYRMKGDTLKKNGHLKEIKFEQFNEQEHHDKIEKIAHYLVESTKISAQDIVEDILASQPTDYINKMYGQVKRRQKAHVVRGCLEIQMGDTRIQVVD